MKWQKIEPITKRWQRFLFFYVLILTWYILAMFGGVSTRERHKINRMEICAEKANGGGEIYGDIGEVFIAIFFTCLVFWFGHDLYLDVKKQKARFYKKNKSKFFLVFSKTIIKYGLDWLNILLFICIKED